MDFGNGSESLHGPPRSIYLAASPHAWKQARSFLKAAIGDRQPPEQVELAALLTTEILSMAARHTLHSLEKPIRVATSVAGDRLRVTVRDREASLVLAMGSDANQDVWAMLLLEEMSARWGTEQSLLGTYIWFEL
jgi:anti-sigma regulatory factor (Ser/Thr protein kinase)